MKKIFANIIFLMGIFQVVQADVSLGNRCEAFQPASFYSFPVIYKKDADAVANSSDYGQNQQPSLGKRYWVAFSDRANNTTYNSPSVTSGEFSHLRFNETVRIAKIQNGFALVYREPVKGITYPNISDNAETRGWVPMKNLLLWPTCPTDSKGIYEKALLAANIDAKEKVADMGRVYDNPKAKSGNGRMKTDMNIYFIMKRAENDLVLLSKDFSLEGASDQRLYGWVSESSFIKWEQRSCLEPTWNLQDVNYFKGKEVTIYGNQAMTKRAAGFIFGRSLNYEEKEGSPTQYRLPKEALRFPILENDTGDSTIYKCTTFGQIGGSLNAAIDSRREIIGHTEEIMEKIMHMNLIIVIDGTQSMKPFYAPVKEAIKMGSDFIRKGYTFKVGVVIYRDYGDGEYLTEYLPMVDKDDPRLSAFLDKGGEYGIKSGAKDRTLEEALYQGINTGLDYKKMGYSPDESNLMVIVGDCGNDEDDQLINPEDLANTMVDYKMNLITFQVRRESQEAFLLFNRQLRSLMMTNVRGLYQKLSKNLKPRMKDVANGYDLKSNLSEIVNEDSEYYVFQVRQAGDGQEMDAGILAVLIKNSLGDFADAIQKRIDIVANQGHMFGQNLGRDDLEAEVDSAFYIEMIGYDRYLELKKTNSMSAFTGYTTKKDESGRDYWKPIIYISADEFNNLVQRLEQVNKIAKNNSNDRKGYVDAMKALLRSMIPDISEEDMDNKSVGEIMALISGLNESSQAFKGPSLPCIIDPKCLTQAEYRELVTSFARKYRELLNIKNRGYRYQLNFNNVKYYWIPIEYLP